MQSARKLAKWCPRSHPSKVSRAFELASADFGSRKYAKLKQHHTKAIPDILYIIHFALTEYRRSTGDVQSYSTVCDTAMASLAVSEFNGSIRRQN
jgi:hypothetical protein